MLVWILAAAVQGQQRPARQPNGSQRQAKPKDNKPVMVMPSFQGELKGIDRKFFLLETEDGNSQKLNVTKKTKCFVGEKGIGVGELRVGDKVAVEVTQAPDGSFDAAIVRVAAKS